MIPEFWWNLHSNQVILENLFIYQKFFLDERMFLWYNDCKNGEYGCAVSYLLFLTLCFLLFFWRRAVANASVATAFCLSGNIIRTRGLYSWRTSGIMNPDRKKSKNYEEVFCDE